MGEGAGIFGSPLGKASGSEKTQEKYAKQLSGMAKDYWKDTEGIRGQLIGRGENFLSGNWSPESTPMYTAGQNQIEDQYGVAQQQMLSSMPSGGGLQQGLGDLSQGRADSLTDLASQIYQNQYNTELGNAYGLGMASPQTAMSGMAGAGGVNSPVLGSQASKQNSAMNTIGNICCFIFIAGHGFLHPIVRRYRELKMNRRNRRGYYWLSDRLVPWMKKSKTVKALVDFGMVKPMTSYGKHYFGLNKIGAIFTPITAFWLLVYSMLGHRPPYRRKGTMEVV